MLPILSFDGVVLCLPRAADERDGSLLVHQVVRLAGRRRDVLAVSDPDVCEAAQVGPSDACVGVLHCPIVVEVASPMCSDFVKSWHPSGLRGRGR